MVQVEISFIDISYLELWRPFYSAERNHFGTFGIGYQQGQFCDFLGIWTSGSREYVI